MARLESQGMKLYYQRNGDWPALAFNSLIAAGPVTLEKLLLQANQATLYGFPPTVDAFVALVCRVRIDDRLPLGKLIRLAFAHYQLYGGQETRSLFEPAPTPAARFRAVRKRNWVVRLIGAEGDIHELQQTERDVLMRALFDLVRRFPE